MSNRTLRCWSFAALMAVTVGLLCLLASGIDRSGLLSLLPALLLGFMLLARRYPGEQLLLRLGQSRKPRRRRAAQVPRPASHPRIARVPRGGLLLACALAVRPPPRSAALS